MDVASSVASLVSGLLLVSPLLILTFHLTLGCHPSFVRQTWSPEAPSNADFAALQQSMISDGWWSCLCSVRACQGRVASSGGSSILLSGLCSDWKNIRLWTQAAEGGCAKIQTRESILHWLVISFEKSLLTSQRGVPLLRSHLFCIS